MAQAAPQYQEVILRGGLLPLGQGDQWPVLIGVSQVYWTWLIHLEDSAAASAAEPRLPAGVEAVTPEAREPCPSCDRDLSYPGAPGHECYTYAEWHARQSEQEPCLCETDFTCLADHSV